MSDTMQVKIHIYISLKYIRSNIICPKDSLTLYYIKRTGIRHATFDIACSLHSRDRYYRYLDGKIRNKRQNRTTRIAGNKVFNSERSVTTEINPGTTARDKWTNSNAFESVVKRNVLHFMVILRTGDLRDAFKERTGVKEGTVVVTICLFVFFFWERRYCIFLWQRVLSFILWATLRYEKFHDLNTRIS